MNWIILIVLLILTGLSLWLRAERYRQKLIETEPRASPLSLAIQELIATAGGIYVSIIALTSFLELDIPDKVGLGRSAVDPLALGSIGVAIFQPLIIKVFNKFVSR